MIDKTSLRELFKAYQDLKMTMKITTIKEEKGGKFIMIKTGLAANEWKLITTDGKPDIERTKKLLEDERQRIAKQIYYHVNDALMESGKQDEFNANFRGGIPEDTSSHEILISYARRACYFLKIFTYVEYTEMGAIVDEQGLLMGLRQYPKHQEDELQEAFE